MPEDSIGPSDPEFVKLLSSESLLISHFSAFNILFQLQAAELLHVAEWLGKELYNHLKKVGISRCDF